MSIISLAVLTLAVTGSPDFDSYRAHIEAASSALRRGDARSAQEWLAGAPKKHRGWEWDYLSAQCDSSVATHKVSESAVTKLALSPDGKTLAVANSKGTITLWNTADLNSEAVAKPRTELVGHKNSVFGLGFSSDGKQMVSTSRDNTIRLWDVQLGKDLGVLGEHPVTPYNATFSPDSKKVVSVGWRMHPETKSPVGLIRVWDVDSRRMVHDMDYTTHPLSSARFASDGRRCYIGCWEYQVGVLNLETLKIEKEITPDPSEAYKAVDCVDLSPDGKFLLTATKDKTAKIFDLASGKQVHTLEHNGQVTSAFYAADGKLIVSSSRDGAVRLWNGASGDSVATLFGQLDPVVGLVVSEDGDRAYSVDSSGVLKVWDTSRPESIEPKIELPGAWSCVFAPDSERLAIGTNGKSVEIRTAAQGALVQSSPAFGSLVVDTAWSPTGKQIAAGSNDGTIRCFDLEGMKELWVAKGSGQVRATDWSKDGKYVAGGFGGSGKGLVIRAQTGEPLHEVSMAAGTLAVAFAPDSKSVAFASDREIRIIDLNSGKVRVQGEVSSSAIFDLAFSPDGRSLCASQTGGQVELFSVNRLQKTWSQRTSGSQWGAHFSPDGKRVATTGYDFATHLWDAASGREVFAIRDLPYQGFDVRFSPDGNRLAHMGGTGTIWVLDRRPFKMRKNQK